eukprot:TRINITY_DN4032_c0_g1_i2.p1 TRINITY_DN4032_c0_g1~~TRINITY_DN4032_c0_g1_i2.p1  ORF type:complete len:514 (+),score=123.03 TRINITY_DN4032_c0_g1_i2:53-1594(+)
MASLISRVFSRALPRLPSHNFNKLRHIDYNRFSRCRMYYNTLMAGDVATPSEQPPTPIKIEVPESTGSESESKSTSSEAVTEKSGSQMTPAEIVSFLDRYIVGQKDAKRLVANALRNKYRRQRLPENIRSEVTPKNILMIGPTGVGKTEIARRLAKLCDAPFIKVEATKYTEVGFHGKDVDDMIKDLVDAALRLVKEKHKKLHRKKLTPLVEEKLIDVLLGDKATKTDRDRFSGMLKRGELDEVEVEIDVPSTENDDMPLFREVRIQVLTLQGRPSKKFTKKKMKIGAARNVLLDMELEKLGSDDFTKEAIALAEQEGIVFIDEIDKICTPKHSFRDGKDASAEGVQRDLLPLVEGTVVSTKHGNVDTTHILFVASGAFSSCQPSDLLAELQGRFPVRVELKPLSEADLMRILKEPEFNLVRQQIELLRTEGIQLVFDESAVQEISRIAAQVNMNVENLGARRLHTIIERVMEEISFEAPSMAPETTITIDAAYIQKKVGKMAASADYSRYLL